MHDAGRISRRGLACSWLLLACLSSAPVFGDDGLFEPTRLQFALDRARIYDGYRVSAAVERSEFKPLEPIVLKVEVKNVQGINGMVPSTVNWPIGAYAWIKVRVHDRQGRLMPKTRFLEEEVRDGAVPIGLSAGSAGLCFPPGEVIRCRLVANLARDMTRSGEYTILVEFPTSQFRDDGRELVSQSKPIKVKVVAEPNRLPRKENNEGMFMPNDE